MTPRLRHDPVEILLVEDNPGDVDLMREVFDEAKVPNHVSVAVDGVEALSFLRSDAGQNTDFVVLDLNVPRKDGREVLAEMKGDPKLRAIPVIIFSSSDAERDLLQAYQLNANSFITKSVDLEEFMAGVRAISDFWLGHAKLPPRVAR